VIVGYPFAHRGIFDQPCVKDEGASPGSPTYWRHFARCQEAFSWPN